MASGKLWSLTKYLYDLEPERYTHATQSAGLRHAAQGQLPKAALANWLANDRLYIHAYAKAAGGMLHTLELPKAPGTKDGQNGVETRLFDWLIDALVNLRREERFFLDVAERYKLNINLADDYGKVPENAKSDGLKLFEALWASLPPASGSQPIPWLEGAIVFWGTEKVYHDAWSWAKTQIKDSTSTAGADDADGGALRNEFIPNWTSDEFAAFVEQMSDIIDQGVGEALAKLPDEDSVEVAKRQLILRVQPKWNQLLEAETAFWPEAAEK